MKSLDQQITEAAQAASLDPLLVQAVIAQESSGRPWAYRFEPLFWERYLKDNPRWADADPGRVSASYGLMQVMFPTAVDYGFTGTPEDLFNIETNLTYGCKVLKAMVVRFHG
jgi:soluble lytic murein transglycosylase-like protein